MNEELTMLRGVAKHRYSEATKKRFNEGFKQGFRQGFEQGFVEGQIQVLSVVFEARYGAKYSRRTRLAMLDREHLTALTLAIAHHPDVTEDELFALAAP